MQQTCTVEDYQRHFKQLAEQASSLTSEQKVEIFISDLQEDKAIKVVLQHPEYLSSAISLAISIEGECGDKTFQEECQLTLLSHHG